MVDSGGKGGADRRRSHSLKDVGSQVETLYGDGTVRYDYRTAHNRAGDADYQTPIPETCTACYKQAEEAAAAGAPVPTSVDAEL